MVGRMSLAAVAASALLFAGGAPAYADDGAYEKLVQVFVQDQGDVDNVTSNYDAAEYKSVEDDGTIQLNVFVTDEEEASLKAAGYRIGATIEDSKTGAKRMQQRQATLDAENLAKDIAQDGLAGAKFQ